ncbi:MAG: diguanylate cyclase [Marinobacterium sp.]|nr:diguanylate cyclase [Marinobacterium sp.]
MNGIEELHWQLGLLQTLDVGLVVVNRDYQVQLWNSFMANHSGYSASETEGQVLWQKFPNLPHAWLQRKLDAVFMLKNQAYINWEQRPYLFCFKSHRPITGLAPFMYQNVSLIPLTSPDGEVNHVGVLIYDVTDVAMARLELQSANRRLEDLSREDRLTGLFNRGYWQECLDIEFTRYQRSHACSTLVMLDIDHFKSINDTWGHPAGDEVIRHLANLLVSLARKTDIIGRYGGEEFAILLVDTDSLNAEIYCERVRRTVESARVAVDGGEICFTVSLGIAQLENGVSSASEWVSRADQALYCSKEGGRNRFSLYRSG